MIMATRAQMEGDLKSLLNPLYQTFHEAGEGAFVVMNLLINYKKKTNGLNYRFILFFFPP